MDVNRAEPTCYITNFPNCASFGQQNAAFSNIVLRLTDIRGLILKLSRNFPIEFADVAVADSFPDQNAPNRSI